MLMPHVSSKAPFPERKEYRMTWLQSLKKKRQVPITYKRRNYGTWYFIGTANPFSPQVRNHYVTHGRVGL